MKKLLIAIAIFGTLIMQVGAQDIVDTNTIQRIVLGDILIQEQPLNSTVSSTSIDDKIQNLNQVKNVADLFKEINGFSLVKRSSYALDPVFRSFKYEQLNIQYDGGIKSMHACPNRMDPTTTFVIPEEIEKIEIIRGPFSGRYGANFGGVINMVTQRAPRTHEMGVHGNVLAGYESNGSSLTTSASLGIANPKYDFMFNLSSRNYGNYSDGLGTEVASSFKSYDYALKLGHNLSDHQRLQFNWRQSFGRDVLHAGLPMDTQYDNSSIASVDYKIDNIGSKLYSLHAKVYYSYVDHLMNNNGRKNFKIVEASTPVDARTYGGKIELELTPSQNHILYLGSDYFGLSRQGNRTRIVKRNAQNPDIVFDIPKTFVDSVWQDGFIGDLGFFGEGKYHYNSNVVFGYGVRLDFVNAKTDNPVAEFKKRYGDFENRTDTNIGGHLTVNYRVSKTLNLQLAVGRGVRSASMEERYINHLAITKDPYEYVGNPLLSPEANHQIEIDLNGKLSGLKYGTNIYYSYITNYITAAVDSTIKRKYLAFKDPKVAKRFQNIDVAIQTGFEIFLEVPVVKNFKVKGELAYVKTNNNDWDEPLPQVAPLTSVITLKYEKDRFWSDLRVKIVAEQDQISLSSNEQVTPGYGVLDLRVGFKPVSNITIAGSVLNILDTYYYDHLNFSFVNSTTSSGRLYEQGRNINLFLRYDF